jgi:hypothetical protein
MIRVGNIRHLIDNDNDRWHQVLSVIQLKVNTSLQIIYNISNATKLQQEWAMQANSISNAYRACFCENKVQETGVPDCFVS